MSSGRKIAVERYGNLDSDVGVMLLHGTPGSGAGPFPRFVDEHPHYQFLSPYRHGYGPTDSYEGRTVADGAYELGLVAEHFGVKKLFVFGRSGGGPHALGIAALFPNFVVGATIFGCLPPPIGQLPREWLLASRMAMENVHAYIGEEEVARDRLRARTRDLTEDSDSLTRMIAVASAGDESILSHPEFVEIRREANMAAFPKDGRDRRGWIDDWYAIFRQSWGIPLSEIRCPTRVVFAADDVYGLPSGAHWMASRIRHAELVEVPGVHSVAFAYTPYLLHELVSDPVSRDLIDAPDDRFALTNWRPGDFSLRQVQAEVPTRKLSLGLEPAF